MDLIGCVPDMSSCNCDTVRHRSFSSKKRFYIILLVVRNRRNRSTYTERREWMRGIIRHVEGGRHRTHSLLICYFCNYFVLPRGFSVLLLCTWFLILVVDVILICIFTGNQIDGLMSGGCSEGRGTLPWFILLWTSPSLLICCCLFCVIENNRDAFYGNSRKIEAEFQTLLL